MRADLLVKHNIDHLLSARRLGRKDLAQWCGRSESWISKIMKEDRRDFPMKYWDRIADFFGVAPYQLLQPGITPLTERRKSGERRSGKDRRAGRRAEHQQTMLASDLSLTAEDVAFLLRVRSLKKVDRVELERLAREAWQLRRTDGASKESAPADDTRSRGTARSPRPRRGRRPKTKNPDQDTNDQPPPK